MKRYRALHPDTGYVWLGFPDKEMAGARGFLDDWSPDERASLLLLANLPHDQFLTLLKRCFINLRTPACDGVSASVLESLALGIPVVASENHRRPSGVVTYEDTDAADMCAKLNNVTEHYAEVKDALDIQESDDNVGKMVSWLTEDPWSNPRLTPSRCRKVISRRQLPIPRHPYRRPNLYHPIRHA